jgi:DNA-binding IclR family transcriptional regulator
MSITVLSYEPPQFATTPRRPGGERGMDNSLRSVGLALDVLECFAGDAELGVSEIARRLGIAKSTSHRLLQTLATRGLIEQHHQTGRYRLGFHVYELGQLALARHELRHRALPTLRRLADATALTVNLAVADGPDVVFVERLVSADGERFLGRSGSRLPSHVTSCGKAIAAFDGAADEARRHAGFPARLSRTVRNRLEWDRTLREVRQEGYAYSDSESFEGAASVAAPVLVGQGAVAAVSVFGPSDLVRSNVERLAPIVIASARRIARTYRG